MRDLAPGLYQWAVLEYPGAEHDIFYRTAANSALRYIWIPPATGSGAPMTMVPSSLVIEDVFCDQARRTTLFNQRITATQRALGMAAHGFAWERPGREPVWHTPRCPAANALTGNEQVTGSAGA